MTNPTPKFNTALIRCAISIAIAVLVLVLIVLFRPSSQAGVPESRFWLNKFHNQYDVVLAGDSRVLFGLSSQPFDDLKIGSALNFGFKGAGLNAEFVDAATARLKTSGPRVLVFGITPNTFTPNAHASSGFTKYSKLAESEFLEMPNWYYGIQSRLRPASLVEILRIARGRTDSHVETFHQDGWVSVASKHPDETYALPFYRVQFKENKVKQEFMDSLVAMVEECCSDGIHVFGFKPPITDAMNEIESAVSGFEYDSYIVEFENAGGVWLSPDVTDCITYDGSHLDGKSALVFSQRIAELVQKTLVGRAGAGEHRIIDQRR